LRKDDAVDYGFDVRVFVPPKPEDRVLMFADKSGVYVFKNGFCTPMGEDISHEIHDWAELSATEISGRNSIG